MLSQFPIFLDLHQTPPLVIGDDSGLAAKLRLLRKAAPIVDVMVRRHATWPDQFAADTGARFHRLGKDVLPGLIMISPRFCMIRSKGGHW